EFTFTAMIDMVTAAGLTALPVRMDEHGLLPHHLQEQCERLRKEAVTPRFLYTIPVGQNPTGSRLPRARYQEIYQICRSYGLTIIEDDPYFYQQHRADKHAGEGEEGEGGEGGDVPGLSGLGPSYLSIDVDGRVIRLDTFSKMLAPGFRIGWLSAALPYARHFDALSFISSQWGCSLSMMLLSQMLAVDGWFESHVRALQLALRSRCLALIRQVEKHLKGLVTYNIPPAGMFLWCTLKAPAPHTERLLEAMRAHGVCVLPGSFASVTRSSSCANFRLSFVVEEEQYMEASCRLHRVVTGLATPQSPANGESFATESHMSLSS
ncbi:MAG: hypothetical protein SGPRY_013167, partial [Prymnesium sp.]